jgi:hypothetical protein
MADHLPTILTCPQLPWTKNPRHGSADEPRPPNEVRVVPPSSPTLSRAGAEFDKILTFISFSEHSEKTARKKQLLAFLKLAPKLLFARERPNILGVTVAHRLLLENCDPDALRIALRRAPIQARIPVDRRRTSLAQEAIKRKLSFRLIQEIMDCDPSCCWRRDVNGQTLLHTATNYAQSHSIFDIVLNRRTTAALVHDVTDARPLHLARENHRLARYSCKHHGRCPPLQKYMLSRLEDQEQADAALLREHTGPPLPRFRRQEEATWQRILSYLPIAHSSQTPIDVQFLHLFLTRQMEIDLCKTFATIPTVQSPQLKAILFPPPAPHTQLAENAPRVWFDEHAFCDCQDCEGKSGNWKGYPLPPPDTAHKLYQALNSPQPVYMVLEQRKQMLHFSRICGTLDTNNRHPQLTEEQRSQIRAFDHNVFAKDDSGLPLGHRALLTGQPRDVIQDILVNPFSIQLLGPTGDTMLSFAIKCNAPLEIVTDIYERSKASGLRLDAKGRSIVHHAAQRRYSWYTLCRVMEWNPGLCILADAQGQFPHMMETSVIHRNCYEPDPYSPPYAQRDMKVEDRTPEDGLRWLAEHAEHQAKILMDEIFPPVHAPVIPTNLTVAQLVIGRILQVHLPSNLDLLPFFYTNREIMIKCHWANPTFDDGFSLLAAESQLWFLSHFSDSWHSRVRPGEQPGDFPLLHPHEAVRSFDWDDPDNPLRPTVPSAVDLPHHLRNDFISANLALAPALSASR